MLLGFDFDSVIGDTEYALKCLFINGGMSPERANIKITDYSIIKQWPEVNLKEIIDDLETLDNTIQIPLVYGAREFLKWYGKKHLLHIITNRNTSDSVYSLLKHRLDAETYKKVWIHCNKEKGELARKLKITHFVDDHIVNCVKLANSGIVPILFTRDWNREKISSRRLLNMIGIRIRSWEELYFIAEKYFC